MITLEDFHFTKKDIALLDKWKKSFKNKKNVKPLIINGIKGCGKTTLANILLNDYSIIKIDSNTNNIEEYIKNIITKKDISMLFNKKLNKAIILDDIFINNKIVKDYISYCKILYNNNCPIIIINSYNIQKIINKDDYYIINIIFHNTQLFNITKTFCNNCNMKITNNNIKNIISKSNNNLNSIKENIKYLKHSNNYKLDSYDINNYDVNNYDTNNYNNIVINNTENLIYKDINKSITDIAKNYSFDNNIILYNIIDNIYNLTNDIDIIIKLYKSILYVDLCDYNCYQTKYNNIYIFYNTIYPISIIRKNKLNKISITYNKYVSYSLQYINSINNYDVKTDIYYYFIKILILFDKDKNILIDLKSYIKYYNLTKKNINSIVKLYFLLNNKKLKSYINTINKLFKK